jgi:hypothetical protein
MAKSNNPFRLRDTTQLTAWLFADLLLGLMTIFLVSVPRILQPPPVPPTLIVNPTNLNPGSSGCTGGVSQPQCTITVQEAASSQGTMTWQVSSDMSGPNNPVMFNPATSTLSPGQSVSVSISSIPCQNGSFVFTASRGATPVTVLWKCTPSSLRLETSPRRYTLIVHNLSALLSSSSQNQDIINQVLKQLPQGRRVGLVIAYGGAPDDSGIAQAKQIAAKIYTILQQLARSPKGAAFQNASYYVSAYGNLYNLGYPSNTVELDLYLFTA